MTAPLPPTTATELVARLRDDRHCNDWFLRQEAADRIDQLSAEVAAKDDGWRDIATAPKDGTQIDLWAIRQTTGHASRYTNCIWGRVVWGTEYIGEPRWLGLEDRYSVVTPTHWMPLPDAPARASLSPRMEADNAG